MKLAALVASAALAFAPLSSLANDTLAPLPGGVAKSSIDLQGDDELLALIIAAGGALVIAGIIFIVANDDDGNPVVTTTTTTP